MCLTPPVLPSVRQTDVQTVDSRLRLRLPVSEPNSEFLLSVWAPAAARQTQNHLSNEIQGYKILRNFTGFSQKNNEIYV